MPTRPPPRLFLLSPAHAGGVRAGLLLNPRAPFPLARQFHAGGLPLSIAFAFTSGLYFRGKISYASRFAQIETGDLIRVITSNAGLMDPATIVGPREFGAFGTTEIDPADPNYYKPLRRHARVLARKIGAEGEAILLGSIATPKYRDILLEAFGSRLFFPSDFVGRGDMSRGALLLRAAHAGRELPYRMVLGAVLTGKRTAGPRASQS
jgi:hypothetical protein